MNAPHNSPSSANAKRLDDTRMDAMMGNLLRVGVLTSSLVVLLGGVVFLVRQGQTMPHDRVFHGEPSDLRKFREIFEYAWTGSGRGIIQVGILLLLATPVARVAFSVFAFLAQRDFKYVVITLIVLGALLSSMFGAVQPDSRPTPAEPAAQTAPA